MTIFVPEIISTMIITVIHQCASSGTKMSTIEKINSTPVGPAQMKYERLLYFDE